MKLKSCLVVLILILECTGCQATPQQQVVVNKNELESMIAQNSAMIQKYDAPESWKEEITFDAGSLAVYLDALIEVPDTDTFPVISIKTMQISQAQADKALSLLVGDAPLYKIKNALTKQEIEDKILSIQKDIADPNSDLNECKKTDPDAYQALLQELQSEIESLREQQESADDTYVPQLASLTFTSGKARLAEEWGVSVDELDGITEYYIIIGQADIGKSEPATISIAHGEMILNNGMAFDNFDEGSYLWGKVIDQTENLNGIVLLKEQAIKIGVDTVQNLGLTDYTLAAIGSDAIHINSYSLITYEDSPKCYVMYFTHKVNNIPVTFFSKYDLFSNYNDTNLDQKYSTPWPDEVLKIVVDDTGIISLSWNGPYEIVDTIAENTELLPFEKIQDIFKEQIKVQGIWNKDSAIIGREIYIEKAVLGMAKIPKKDDPDTCLLVPAWDFFGYSVYQYNGTQPGGYQLDENNQYTETFFKHSFLTINAIDGSVIQRDQHYYQD